MDLQATDLRLKLNTRDTTIQKYIRMLGEIQHVTDKRNGASSETLKEIAKRYKVSHVSMSYMKKEYLDQRVSGRIKYYTWKPSNRNLTYRMMALRSIERQHNMNKIYAGRPVIEVMPKQVTLHPQATQQMTLNVTPQEVPQEFAQDGYKLVINDIKRKLSDARDAQKKELDRAAEYKSLMEGSVQKANSFNGALMELEDTISHLEKLSAA